MKFEHVEIKEYVLKLYLLWGLIIGGWTVVHTSTPLILKDIDHASAPMWQGVFLSTNAFCGAVLCAFAGSLSDRIGRIEVLSPWVMYFASTTLAIVVAEECGSVYALWYARTAAIAVPSILLHAFIADFLSGNTLLEAYGYLGGTMGVATLISSFVSGVLNRSSRMASLLFSCALGILAAVVVRRLPIPDAVAVAIREKIRISSGRDDGDVERVRQKTKHTEPKATLTRRLLRSPHLIMIGLASAIFRMAMMNLNLLIALFLNYRLNWNLSQISYLVAFTALLTIVAQTFGMRLCIAYNIVFPVFVALLLATEASITLYAFVESSAHVYIIHVFIALSTVATSMFNSRISAIAPAGLSGIALGMVGTVQNVVEVGLALFFGKLLRWSIQSYPPESIWCGIPLMVNGATMLVCVGLVCGAQVRYGHESPGWSIAAPPEPTDAETTELKVHMSSMHDQTDRDNAHHGKEGTREKRVFSV